MNTFWKKLTANIVFVSHCIIVLIIGFGWIIPAMWLVYATVLIGTLASWIVFGFCILSKWEFELRKSIDPSINYDFSFSSFYTYKLTHGRISNTFISVAGTFYMTAALAITGYFRFLY